MGLLIAYCKVVVLCDGNNLIGEEMKSKYIVALIGVTTLVVALAGSANAALFDFMTQANALEKGYSAYSLTDSGITVNATGTSVTDTDNSPDYFAYLDRGNAGLGVCKNINSSDQCNPASDDNLTAGELLTLDFGQSVTISEILFRDEGHVAYPDNTSDDFVLSIDGGTFQSYQLQSSFTTLLTGQNFRFAVDDYTNGNWVLDSDQLYIQAVSASAPVPEPATMLLFGIGLAGLAGVQRHKKK